MANKRSRVRSEYVSGADKIYNINENDIVDQSRTNVQRSDPYYARWLLVEYAGKDSKLTSISDYILMSIELSDKDEELSELFEEIADDEIRHFRQLGSIIKNIGGSPGVNLNALNDLKLNELKDYLILKDKNDTFELLSELYEKEIRSANNYRRLIGLTDDISIKKILRDILNDELSHKSKLEQQIIRYKKKIS